MSENAEVSKRVMVYDTSTQPFLVSPLCVVIVGVLAHRNTSNILRKSLSMAYMNRKKTIKHTAMKTAKMMPSLLLLLPILPISSFTPGN